MLQELLAAINFDIRGEMLAVMQLLGDEDNMPTIEDQFIFKQEGKLYPGVMTDIIEVNQEYHEDKISISLRRTGILGNLPEMLYIHPIEEAMSDSEKARKYREQLESTIAFFDPFDHVIFQPKIKNSLWEIIAPYQIIDSLLEMPEWDPWLRQFVVKKGEEEYELLDSKIRETDGIALNNRKNQARYNLQRVKTLLKLGILISDRICGDYTRTEAFFEEILGQRVKIEEVSDLVYKIPKNQQFYIGKARLGQDTVLGTQFQDGISSLEIQIHDVPIDKIEDYLPAGASRNILERILYFHFLPLEAHWETRIFKKTQILKFTLGYDNVSSLLGYTTQLKILEDT